MIKLFYSPPWKAFVPPEKPDKKNYPYVLWSYEIDMQNYEKAYAEAKANALEVSNAELIFETVKNYAEVLHGITVRGFAYAPNVEYDWKGSAVIKDGKYILSV